MEIFNAHVRLEDLQKLLKYHAGDEETTLRDIHLVEGRWKDFFDNVDDLRLPDGSKVTLAWLTEEPLSHDPAHSRRIVILEEDEIRTSVGMSAKDASACGTADT